MQTISANRPLYQRPRPATRCTGNQVEQATPCTAGIDANGLLKHKFLPKYQASKELPEGEKVEGTYFKSIKRLARFYNIEAIDVSQYCYPYNILLSNWDITRKIWIKGRFRQLSIIESDEGETKVSVTETLNTSYDLYYIPIASLYRCLENGAGDWVKLLLGVCVYLYRKAGVCHYKDGESYMCYLYDIMDSWIEDDREGMDEADYNEQRANLDEMSAIGDKIEPYLLDEEYLIGLQTIIQRCKPESKFQKECVQLAKNTLALWMEFPHANLYQNTGEECDDEDDYYGTGRIRVTDYISFIGETSGNVYEAMKEILNEDFNNRSGSQDFEVTIDFDTPKGQYKDQLGYEEKVIEIINELCCLLSELP